jgi:hypothetical protein
MRTSASCNVFGVQEPTSVKDNLLVCGVRSIETHSNYSASTKLGWLGMGSKSIFVPGYLGHSPVIKIHMDLVRASLHKTYPQQFGIPDTSVPILPQRDKAGEGASTCAYVMPRTNATRATTLRQLPFLVLPRSSHSTRPVCSEHHDLPHLRAEAHFPPRQHGFDRN